MIIVLGKKTFAKLGRFGRLLSKQSPERETNISFKSV